MKRERKYLEKDSLVIYVGTAIFFLLAIALAIIMYMFSKTTTKLKDETSQLAQQEQISENYESVSLEMGKSVDEQEISEEKANIEENNNDSENKIINSSNTSDMNNIETKNNKSDVANKQNTENSNEVSTAPNKINDSNSEGEDSSNSDSVEIKKEVTFIKPTEGDIICEYAKENLIYSETLKEWITHTAIDIKADKTSVIKASADGIVKSIVNDPRYGLTVVIEHADGYQTVYSNLLTTEFVVIGEEVCQGQTIGTAGNTAAFESTMECHLHFEIIKDGEYLDPNIYLK